MDGITFGYLGPDAWLYLRRLCDGQGRRLDSAAALAHARSCPACAHELAEIAAGRQPDRAATLTMTRVMAAVTA